MTKAILPLVTIIMPIRNEADFIERSMRAVLNQDYPHERMELLVSDGMSTDETRSIISRIQETSDITIEVLNNPRQIVPTGFNIALKKAKGEIIVRVDGHCEIASDYITQCVRLLEESDAAGVGGPIETVSDTILGKSIAVAMSSRFGVGGSIFRVEREKELFADTIPFPAYRREVMNVVGPLDEELMRNQDDEYNYRLRSRGYKLLLSPRVKSTYQSRSDLRTLWRQYFQYGLYKVRVLQKHPQQMRPRQFAPVALTSALLVGSILTPLNGIMRRIWLSLLLVYASANLAASFFAARRHGWQHFKYMPFVFSTLHFSYGLGFMNGLWKFRKRWKD